MAIKGQNLRVFVGTGSSAKCVALATEATLNLTTQTESSSTKDDADNFEKSEAVGFGWSIQTSALVCLTDPSSASGKTTVDLIALWAAGEPVTVTWDQTQGTNNRTGMNSTLKKTGQALITDVSISAGNRQNATYQVTFQGTGAIS